ncbi:MAG: hypothetical protein ACK44S_04270 [Bacteroidota bacterium]|jgi:hypothetical protein
MNKTIIRFHLAFFCICLSMHASAQVGVGTTSPNASSILDISSTTKGVLLPSVNLTSTTMDLDANGTTIQPVGLLVYNSGSTLTKGFYYWNGSEWVSISAAASAKNIYCNNTNPNNATIFDDVIPAVTHSSSFVQNQNYTYFGTDGSCWIWNGSSYTTYTPTVNLNVGQTLSVYRTMSTTAADGTHLPEAGLITLDGLVRVGLNRFSATFYKPYIQNISANAINVTFTSGFYGATAENRYGVTVSIPANGYQGIDNNDWTYWTSLTETLVSDVILPNGKWYEITWLAFEANSLKQIYISVTRKF